MKTLLRFLQEDNGNLSSIRLMSLLFILVFLADYVLEIIRNETFDPTLTVAGMVISILGLKVVQKVMEK